jgi:hypothetical protein
MSWLRKMAYYARAFLERKTRQDEEGLRLKDMVNRTHTQTPL